MRHFLNLFKKFISYVVVSTKWGCMFKGLKSKRRGIIIRRSVSIGLVCSMLIFTAYDAYSFTGGLLPARMMIDKEENLPAKFSVEGFSLPVGLASIRERYTPAGSANENIILHIQDAHCNYNAQKAINEIIQYISSEYGVTAINLEGGAGPYDISIFTDITDKKLREKVSDYFVSRGLLSGPEYFAVNNPDRADLWGIESVGLYLKNLSVYRGSLDYKSDVRRSISILEKAIGRLKDKIYSDKLKLFDGKYNGYKNKSIDFQDYLDFLFKCAREEMINIKNFKNVYLLKLAMRQEKDIDFDRANRERDEYIDELHDLLSKKDIEELVLKTVDFREKVISDASFYEFLVKKGALVDLDLDDYPDLQKYIVYISVYSAIDKTEMMYEIESLEDTLKGVMFENDEQEDLAVFSKNLTLLKNMFDITLTKYDYEYYSANRVRFSAGEFRSFIERMSARYGLDAGIGGDMKRLDVFREKIEKFYEYSFLRDEAFVKNLRFSSREIESGKSTGKICVLVTGGFHAGNIADIFRKEGYSYISIMPSFSNARGYVNPYFDLLSGGGDKFMSNLSGTLSSSIAVASALTELGRRVDKEQPLIYAVYVKWAAAVLSERDPKSGIMLTAGDSVRFIDKNADVKSVLAAGEEYDDYIKVELSDVEDEIRRDREGGHTGTASGESRGFQSEIADSYYRAEDMMIGDKTVSSVPDLAGIRNKDFSRRRMVIDEKDGYAVELAIDQEISAEMGQEIDEILEMIRTAIMIRGPDKFKNMPDEPVYITLLDRSKYLFEDHKRNSIIGINRVLFDKNLFRLTPEERDILFQVGITHELRHESLKGGPEDHDKAETELTMEDAELILDLAGIWESDGNALYSRMRSVVESGILHESLFDRLVGSYLEIDKEIRRLCSPAGVAQVKRIEIWKGLNYDHNRVVRFFHRNMRDLKGVLRQGYVRALNDFFLYTAQIGNREGSDAGRSEYIHGTDVDSVVPIIASGKIRQAKGQMAQGEGVYGFELSGEAGFLVDEDMHGTKKDQLTGMLHGRMKRDASKKEFMPYAIVKFKKYELTKRGVSAEYLQAPGRAGWVDTNRDKKGIIFEEEYIPEECYEIFVPQFALESGEFGPLFGYLVERGLVRMENNKVVRDENGLPVIIFDDDILTRQVYEHGPLAGKPTGWVKINPASINPVPDLEKMETLAREINSASSEILKLLNDDLIAEVNRKIHSSGYGGIEIDAMSTGSTSRGTFDSSNPDFDFGLVLKGDIAGLTPRDRIRLRTIVVDFLNEIFVAKNNTAGIELFERMRSSLESIYRRHNLPGSFDIQKGYEAPINTGSTEEEKSLYAIKFVLTEITPFGERNREVGGMDIAMFYKEGDLSYPERFEAQLEDLTDGDEGLKETARREIRKLKRLTKELNIYKTLTQKKGMFTGVLIEQLFLNIVPRDDLTVEGFMRQLDIKSRDGEDIALSLPEEIRGRWAVISETNKNILKDVAAVIAGEDETGEGDAAKNLKEAAARDLRISLFEKFRESDPMLEEFRDFLFNGRLGDPGSSLRDLRSISLRDDAALMVLQEAKYRLLIPYFMVLRGFEYDEYERLIRNVNEGSVRLGRRVLSLDLVTPDEWGRLDGKIQRRLDAFMSSGAIAKGRWEIAVSISARPEDLVPEALVSGEDRAERERIIAKVTAAVDNIKDRRLNVLGDDDPDKERAMRFLGELETARLYLFNARVDSPEDYLLGFNIFRDGHLSAVGLSVEMLDRLNGKDLEEYIFHETLVEAFPGTHDINYGKADRAGSIQGKIFGGNTLKKVLRRFVTQMVMQKERETLKSDIGMEMRLVDRAPSGIAPERVDETIAMGRSARQTQENVTVVAGYRLPHVGMGAALKKAVRRFNSEVKLKFGSKGDNQQVRVNEIVYSDDGELDEAATMISFLEEIQRFDETDSEKFMVVFLPEIGWNTSDEGLDRERTAKEALTDWLRDRNNIDAMARADNRIDDVYMRQVFQKLGSDRLVVQKDGYWDCYARAEDGTQVIQFPDIAARFNLARHYAAFLVTDNPAGKRDIMVHIIDAWNYLSGEEITIPGEVLENEDLFMRFLNTMILSIKPLDYREIAEYESMLEKVGRSL